MSIGIITIMRVNNYGAELQAYALQKQLNNLGYDAEILDYLFYKHKDYYYTRAAQPFVHLGFKRKLKEILYPIVEKMQSLPFKKVKVVREVKFEAFHRQNTKLSSIQYKNIDLLYNTQMDYDVFMVGSDQVWNPYSNTNLKPYFLTFAPPEKKKIAYASSFGVSFIPDHAHAIYRDCLNRLDYISVREEQGVKLVKELTGRQAEHVLDPTLLLDSLEWAQIATYPSYKKPYILLYVLTESSYTTQLAKEMAFNLGYDIIRICKQASKEDKDKTIENVIDAGPSEFLGLFLNASFILTNSYHGTTFSVNFQKPFYSILRPNKSNNSRQQDFLFSLNLRNRILEESNTFPVKKNYFFDYTQSNHLLAKQKEKSINYLINAINGAKR